MPFFQIIIISDICSFKNIFSCLRDNPALYVFIYSYVHICSLKKGGQRSSLILRNNSFLQLGRDILQDFARVVGEVQVSNLEQNQRINTIQPRRKMSPPPQNTHTGSHTIFPKKLMFTSEGTTAIIAKASLSSLTGAHPT